MTDPIEQLLAPTAIERTMAFFDDASEHEHARIVQARKAVTQHIFGLIARGEVDEHRLVIAGLSFLKQFDSRAQALRSA